LPTSCDGGIFVQQNKSLYGVVVTLLLGAGKADQRSNGIMRPVRAHGFQSPGKGYSQASLFRLGRPRPVLFLCSRCRRFPVSLTFPLKDGWASSAVFVVRGVAGMAEAAGLADLVDPVAGREWWQSRRRGWKQQAEHRGRATEAARNRLSSTFTSASSAFTFAFSCSSRRTWYAVECKIFIFFATIFAWVIVTNSVLV
jgi:hypothetical protein